MVLKNIDLGHWLQFPSNLYIVKLSCSYTIKRLLQSTQLPDDADKYLPEELPQQEPSSPLGETGIRLRDIQGRHSYVPPDEVKHSQVKQSVVWRNWLWLAYFFVLILSIDSVLCILVHACLETQGESTWIIHVLVYEFGSVLWVGQ